MLQINDRVQIETVDESHPMVGTVTGFQFGKVLILCDEYPTASYSFDIAKVKLLEEKL